MVETGGLWLLSNLMVAGVLADSGWERGLVVSVAIGQAITLIGLPLLIKVCVGYCIRVYLARGRMPAASRTAGSDVQRGEQATTSTTIGGGSGSANDTSAQSVPTTTAGV